MFVKQMGDPSLHVDNYSGEGSSLRCAGCHGMFPDDVLSSEQCLPRQSQLKQSTDAY